MYVHVCTCTMHVHLHVHVGEQWFDFIDSAHTDNQPTITPYQCTIFDVNFGWP